MKIVVVGTRGFPGVQGGVEKHCEELYPRLVRLGCDVSVFTRSPYISEEKRLKEWKGVKFIHLWCPRKKSFETLIHTFISVIKAKGLRPDILHIHSIGPSLLVPLAKRLGMKVIMTHHGPDYERAKWGKIARAVLRYGEKHGILYSDRIIAISKGIKEFIKSKYGRDSVFIPNGVTLPHLVPPGAELKKWGLKPKEYFFTACRFVPEKGLLELIDAYKKIKDSSFKLVIAGDADHETDYSRRVKKVAAETKGVVLTGFITGTRLAELYSNAGLFVLPSYYEGLPIALLEALSYGLPVIVSDISANRELLLSEFRYFKPGNIDELSFKLVEGIKKGLSGDEKEKYLKLLKTQFDWDTIAERIKGIYEKVLNL